MSRLISPYRRRAERPVFDLTKIHASSVSHGIRVVLGWFWDQDEREYEPCIALMKLRPPVVPCIIPLSSAWRWALHDNTGDPAHVAKTVFNWIYDGALPGNPHAPVDAMAVLNAVDSRLRDLVMMPPRPPGDIVTVADIEVRDHDTGKIINETEVKHDV